MRKIKLLQKTFSLITSLSLLFQSCFGFLTTYNIAYAQDEPTPTPTVVQEQVSEPTPTPVEPTPTIGEPTPTPEPTPTEEPAFTPTSEPEATLTPTISEPPPTPTIEAKEPQEEGKLSATIVDNVSATSVNELDLDAQVVEESASLVTDKADYAPTDTALITGTSFKPNTEYLLVISSQDDPPVTDETKIITDETGSFVYAYQLDGTYRPNYKVEAKKLSGELITETSFTDSQTSPTTVPENVCPAGNVKYEVDDARYEYTNNSATVSIIPGTNGTKNKAEWQAEAGYEIVGVCIKIGGPGGEILKDGLLEGGGPFDYDISHVVLTTRPSQQLPFCGDGIVNGNEECDYGDLNGQSNCSSDCNWVVSCEPEMIANGSFETPAVTHSAKWDIFESFEVPGWTAEWYGGSGGDNDPQIELHAGVNGWTSSDDQYAELDSDWDGPGGPLNGEAASVSIYQSIPVIAGYEYRVSWSYSPRPNHNDNRLKVEVDGDSVFDSGIMVGGGSVNWQDESRTFVPDSDSVIQIRFTETGNPDSYGMFLDNVSVECLGPEILPVCGDGKINQEVEECDGTDGVTPGQNFCTSTCKLVPIYDGQHSCSVGVPVKITENPLVLSSTSGTPIQYSFEGGKKYLLEAFGTYSYNKNSVGNLADPAYGTNTNWSSVRSDIGIWGTKRGVTSILGDLGLGMGVIEWDDDSLVNGDHLYRKAFSPSSDVTADFVISDWYGDWYGSAYDNQGGMGDNQGNLQLDVYECQEISTVTVCKYDNLENPLSNWNVSLKGDLVDTVDVLPNGSDYNSGVLAEDDYVLEANGYYTYRPGTSGAEYTDANYSKRHPDDAVYGGSYVPWVNVNSFPAPHTGWLGVMINGSPTDWSDYFNPDHIYTLGYQDYTGSFSFKILDDYYGDNSGKIPVGIYKGYAGTTGENGCVTFENVPFGEYTLGEVVKDGWHNVEGNGDEVIVDDESEGFELINARDPYCGDGNVDKGEECDGSAPEHYRCTKTCELEYIPWCGDGIKQEPEECDGTEGVAGDGSNFCTDTCKLIPVYSGDNTCPDGKVKSALPVASETIKTNPTATEYTVVSGLTAGNDYLIEVSGKYQFDPGMATKWADAAYASYAADGAGSLPWNLRYDLGIRPTTGKDAVGNYKSRGITSLISDMGTGAMGVVDWGDFDEGHNYSFLYHALASSPKFIVSEWYGDWYKTSQNNYNTFNNLGSLNLEVYECVEPGIIKGTKYLDENANGVHDYNLSLSDVYESQLLNGWTIRLYDQNWNKADEMDTANLGNKGQYIFNGVVLGTYYVCEVMEDGWEQTGPKEGAGSINNNWQQTGNGLAVKNESPNKEEEGPVCWKAEVEPGETDGWLKFGNTQYGSISGVKWEDVNGDGVRDAGENGLPGWTICLDLNKDLICDSDEPTGVTNASGEYIFENLVSGEYWVIEEQQQGWVQTAPRDVIFHRVDLEAGANKVADFGNFKLGMIQGKKYDDLNYNGSRQSGEPYLDEWIIRLYREGEGWEPVGEESTGHTGTLGQYRFENLEKGRYKICEVLQTGWIQTQPTGASNNERPDEAPRCREVTIDRSGRQRTSQVFGNTNLGSVVVYKFEDINGNGFKDENETLLSGWDIVIVMDKVGGSGNTQLTDENGSTVFSLTSGDYLLYENIDEGWVQTGIYCEEEEVGTYDSENDIYSLTLNPGQELSCYVGNFRLGRIFGYKYNDINDDGNLDVGETGVNGWGMCLKANEVVCLQTTTTDENGYYEFTGLRAGIYTVIEEDRSSLGWRASNPENGVSSPLAVTSGSDVGFNFYNAPPASILINKTNNNSSAGVGDTVGYILTITVGKRTLSDMTLVDTLPEGFVYQTGTAKIDGNLAEPAITNDGKTLTWTWGEVLAGSVIVVTYDIRIEPSNQPSAYTNIAYVSGHGSPTLIASEIVESIVRIDPTYSYSGTAGGQILGASTGQVLGASTLPAAGSETWYLLAALSLIGTGLFIRKKYLH